MLAAAAIEWNIYLNFFKMSFEMGILSFEYNLTVRETKVTRIHAEITMLRLKGVASQLMVCFLFLSYAQWSFFDIFLCPLGKTTRFNSKQE